MIVHHFREWIACFLAGASLCQVLFAADDPKPAIPPGSLQLSNGGFVAGRLLNSDSPDEIAWQGTQFAAPFQFRWDHVDSIVYPQPAVVPRPAGEFCIELSGGDVLYGSLLGVSDKLIKIDEAKLGKISVWREQVRRIFRWNTGRELIFVGPAGLKGWTEGATGQWSELGGHLSSNQPEARLFGDFNLPPQAAFEFELAWDKVPNFALSLGTAPETDGRGFRLEVIDSWLVALRETKQDADVAPVSQIAAGEGRIHLLTYVDQTTGRFLVYSAAGKQLADLRLAEPEPKIGSGLTLANFKGDVRLERLRISRWNGVPPTGLEAGQARFQRANGASDRGRLAAFDSEKNVLTFLDGQTETQVPLKDVDEILLEAGSSENAAQNLHLSYLDGTRIGGKLTRIGALEIALTCPAIVQEFSAPLRELRALQFVKPKPLAPDLLPRRETLELPGTKLRGRLIDGIETAEASGLVWEPELSRTASPLNKRVSGRIVYRVPPPPAKAVVNPNVTINRRQAQVKMLDVGKLLKAAPSARAVATTAAQIAPEDRFLHLRSGDTIPCRVASINEEGVTITTSLSEATFVPHDKVKAVQLIKTNSPPKLAKIKKERLLTLPRMQRDSPPTQLVCSQNGDILRGRIMEMSDAQIKLEVKLDVRQIPRDRISQIIWLHDDELGEQSAGKDAAQEPAPAAEQTRIQVQRSDGIRLTYFVEQVQESMITGRSEVLGLCRTNLGEVDQLLIGDAIEQTAAGLAYHRWKLHHAVDPKFVQEENGEGDPGRDSPLVGKPAPDFTLSYLDGTKFHLGSRRGDVVVLDFWATWCGPCMQVMPQVELVAGEFQDAGVRLVAVNLEESPKQITATLERHKLNVSVVLDQDGVVGRKYAANAIPQTVIIDKAGNVARVFVGGGPDYAEQLRAALKEVTQPPAADAPAGNAPQN